MLFLALQIGNELLPDTVSLECWRHTILGTRWTHAQECWPLELWTQLKELHTLSHSSQDVPVTVLTLIRWDYFSGLKRFIKHITLVLSIFSLLCERTHCVRGTQMCTLGTPVFGHNCSSFKTCSLHICLYLFEKTCNRSTVCFGGSQV